MLILFILPSFQSIITTQIFLFLPSWLIQPLYQYITRQKPFTALKKHALVLKFNRLGRFLGFLPLEWLLYYFGRFRLILFFKASTLLFDTFSNQTNPNPSSGLTTHMTVLYTWGAQRFVSGAACPFQPHYRFVRARKNFSTTIESAKKLFVPCRGERLLSFATGSRTFWSLAKAVSCNFWPINFPPICNSSGNLVCEPHEKTGHFAFRFASSSTPLNYSTPLASFSLTVPPFYPVLPLRRSGKYCCLWAFPN